MVDGDGQAKAFGGLTVSLRMWGSVAGSRQLPGCTNSSFLCVSPETVRTDQGHPLGQGLEDRTGMGEVGTVVRGKRTWRSPPCDEWKAGKVGRSPAAQSSGRQGSVAEIQGELVAGVGRHDAVLL